MDKLDVDRFERVALPHLDSAYALARHLTRNGAEAEDAVQEAYLRALRHFDGFRGGDARAWVLAIVRNVSLSAHCSARPHVPFDERDHGVEIAASADARALASDASSAIDRALKSLSVEFREAIVLRELQGLSYREIAEVTGAPIGTVMSRLARAREQLRGLLAHHVSEELR